MLIITIIVIVVLSRKICQRRKNGVSFTTNRQVLFFIFTEIYTAAFCLHYSEQEVVNALWNSTIPRQVLTLQKLLRKINNALL